MGFFYSVISFFSTGGVFMYPILIVFAVGLAIASERYITLTIVTRKNQVVWDQVQPVLAEGDFEQARKMTSGVLGVNIMVALTNFGDMVRTSIEEGIDIIFAGAGLPFDLPGYRPLDAKTKLVPIISSARAAKIICKKWLFSSNHLFN